MSQVDAGSDRLEDELESLLSAREGQDVMFARAVMQALPSRPVGIVPWRRALILAAFHAAAAVSAYVVLLSLWPELTVRGLSAAHGAVERAGGAIVALDEGWMGLGLLALVGAGILVAFARHRAHTAPA